MIISSFPCINCRAFDNSVFLTTTNKNSNIQQVYEISTQWLHMYYSSRNTNNEIFASAYFAVACVFTCLVYDFKRMNIRVMDLTSNTNGLSRLSVSSLTIGFPILSDLHVCRNFKTLLSSDNNFYCFFCCFLRYASYGNDSKNYLRIIWQLTITLCPSYFLFWCIYTFPSVNLLGKFTSSYPH